MMAKNKSGKAVVVDVETLGTEALTVVEPKGRAAKGKRSAAEAEEGAGSPAGAALAEALQAWLEAALELGVPEKQLVWDLHVMQGQSLLATAQLLHLTPERAGLLYAERRQELVAAAPSAVADFTALREELRERLLATYELACAMPGDVRFLGVRLKALDQMTKLHGLNLDSSGGAGPAEPPYAMPEDVEVQVRNAVLELHGRREEVEAARAALGR